MSHAKSSRARHWMRRFSAVAFLLGVVSCQNTSTENSQGEVLARITFGVDENYKVPDSASFVFKGEGGSANLAQKPSGRMFTASMKVPSAPGNDTVYLTTWRYGLRVLVVPATGSGDLKIDSSRVVREKRAMDLLKLHDSLHGVDSVFFEGSPLGVRRAYAKQLVEGDSAVVGYPASKPYGIDSVALLDNICLALARQRTSFVTLYAHALLGSDSATWRKIVLERIASKLLSSADSGILFPPAAVRVVSPISVTGSLVAGGDENGLGGAFAWDSGMVVLDAEILKAGEVVKGAVDVALWQSQADAEVKWDLAGRASIRARSRTAAGEYELRITARDAKGNSAVSSTRFNVSEPPAGVPRLVVVEPSGTDTVRLPFATETVHIVARVRNPAEVKPETFSINGIKPVQVDDSTWSTDVRLPPSGTAVIVGVRVEGINGVVGSEYFLAVRAKDQEAPKLVRGTGATDAVVPFDTASAYVSWTVSDNHKVGAVKIAGVAASPLGNTFWSRVPLVVGRNVVRVEALDSTGNKSVDSLVIARTKDLEAPKIVALEGTEDHELVGEADLSVLVNWNVSDNHRVEKVSIAGEPAVHAGGSNVWFRYVVVKEGENKIVVRAWDSTGNESLDSIVIRKSVNPDHPVLKALSGTYPRAVSFETTSVEVGWQVLNPKCLGTVEIAGVATSGQEGKFQRKIELAVGDTTVLVVARDTLGNITRASVKITRKRDTIAPKCEAGPGSALIVDGKIRATVSWVVTDNHKLKSVRIEGGDATSVGNVYGRTLDIALDQKWIRIVATDSCDNQTLDSLRIVGAPDTLAPRIYAGTGATNRTVASEIAETVVSWTVVDDRDVTRVEIAGKLVDPVGALYGRSVPLATGRNTIRIDAVDAAGNRDSSEVVIIRLDANGPEIVMVQSPTTDTLPESAEALDVFFKVADPQGVKSVTVGGKEIQGSAGVYNANVPLAFGKNSIEILAKDADGALSARIIEVFRLDQTAPVVKPKSGAAIQVDGLVTEYDLAWDVSDNSGAFTATLDGKPIACADGICKARVPLATGANKFVFEVKDAAGLATKSEVNIVRNDDKAPEVSMLAPTDPALPVMVTDVEPKTVLRWTAKDNLGVASSTANGAMVTKNDAGEYFTEIDMTGRFGDSTVAIVAKDAEGNPSIAKTVTIRHPDLVVPAIALVAPAPPTTILGATDAAPKAVVRWTVSDNSGAFTTTANGAVVAKSASSEFALEVDMTGRYADSVVLVAAKDAAGNLAAPISVTVRHADETAPKLAPIEPAAAGGVVWVKVGQNLASVKWKVDESVGLASCTANGVVATADVSGIFSVSIDMGAKVGDSTVKIVAKDKAGNVSQELAVVVRRDLVKPVVATSAPVSGNPVEALPAGTTMFTVKWSATDAGGLASTTINGVEFAAKAEGGYTLPVDMALKNGDSAIWIVAKDMAGNVSDTTKFVIRRDATKPVIVKVAPAPALSVVPLGISPATYAVQWKVTEAGGIGSSEINGVVVAPNASGVYARTINMASKTGDSAIWIVAKDAAGNVSDTTKFVIRRDATKPVIVKVAPAPALSVVPLGISPATYVVQWKVTEAGGMGSSEINGVVVAPNASGVYSRTINMASKSGDSAIWIVAKDLGGNVSDTTKFKIHRDAVAPTLVDLPTDTVFLMGNQRFFSWNAMDDEEVVWSGVNGQKIEKAESGYYEFMFEITREGDSTLVFVAKDAAGNVATKSVVVRHDMTAPVAASTAPVREILVEEGVSSVVVSWTVTDNDKISAASIDGEAALVSGNIYSKSVAYAGSQPKVVPIMIFDRCGNSTYSTVTLVRRALKMAIGGYFGLHLDRTGVVTLWGGEGIVLPANLGKVRDIAAAGRGAFFLKGDGTIAPAGDVWPNMPTPVWPRVKRLFAGTVGWDNPTVVGILDNDSFCVAGAHVGLNFVNAAIASNTRVMKVALGTNFIILQDLDSIATSWVVTGGSTVVKTVHGKARSISGSYDDGVVLKADGNVVNVIGAMVTGASSVSMVGVGLYQAVGVTESGIPKAWSSSPYGNGYGQANFPAVFPTDVVGVGSGYRYNAFLTSTGKVLALGEPKSIAVPVSIKWTAP
jgi:hypothetical protein